MSATLARLRVLAPAARATAPGAGAEVAPGTCVTCGQPSTTPYCPHCGERRASDHAYTLHALAADVWDFVAPADGRTLRSLWTLVRHPGALTVAYMRGVRRPYLPPLGLFFFVNALFFIYVGLTKQHIFNTPLQIHVTNTTHAEVARRLVDARIAARHVTYAEYERRFNAVVETQSKTLVVAMVPGFALLVAVAAARRRRSALYHLAFSFHAVAALLVGLIAGSYLVLLPVALAIRFVGGRHSVMFSDSVASLFIVVPFFAWLVLALRRAYDDGWVAAVIKGAALMFGLLYVLFAYRALLFFTTFWAT